MIDPEFNSCQACPADATAADSRDCSELGVIGSEGDRGRSHFSVSDQSTVLVTSTTWRRRCRYV